MVAFALGLRGSSQRAALPAAIPTFVTQTLGAPKRAAPAVDAGAVHATIARRGFTFADALGSVSLAAAGSAARPRTSFAHGTIRPNRFGYETITVSPGGAEELQTVLAHHGVRTWKWQISARTSTRG